MSATKTRMAVNLVGVPVANWHTVYNDRLLDGRRSLKVIGWGFEEYRLAGDILYLAGCKVQLKKGPFSMSEYRLIVDES